MFRSFVPAFLFLLIVLAFPLCGEEKKGPAKSELSEPEQKLLEWTNKVRAEHKLPALKLNATLLKVARGHAANMARQGKMSHVLDGKNPTQRIRAAGYVYTSIGEIIGMSDGLQLETVEKAWMASKPHRENLLKERYREIGIGIAHNDKGEYYYTQVFGKPRR
jgi:uncharacterized protein YkwD